MPKKSQTKIEDCATELINYFMQHADATVRYSNYEDVVDILTELKYDLEE